MLWRFLWNMFMGEEFPTYVYALHWNNILTPYLLLNENTIITSIVPYCYNFLHNKVASNWYKYLKKLKIKFILYLELFRNYITNFQDFGKNDFFTLGDWCEELEEHLKVLHKSKTNRVFLSIRMKSNLQKTTFY